jgi:hypothetical protein
MHEVIGLVIAMPKEEIIDVMIWVSKISWLIEV